VNAISVSESSEIRNNINGYVPAVNRISSDKDIIPIQLQDSERTQADQNISNIITAVGAIGGSIAGGFITQRLAERIEKRKIEARKKEKQIEKEEREKEKQSEREQIRKTAQIELTEYRNILTDILAKEKDPSKDSDSKSDLIILSKVEYETISLPNTSYLSYPFEKRNLALTVEEAAKVERVYKNGLKIPSYVPESSLIMSPGRGFHINVRVIRIRLDETEKALAELHKNSNQDSVSSIT
jgi:hypothetical protein